MIDKIKKVVVWEVVILCVVVAQQERWVYVYHDPNGANTELQHIIFGQDGYIYVGGNSGDPTCQAFILKFTPDGVPIDTIFLWGGSGFIAHPIEDMVYCWNDVVFANGASALGVNRTIWRTAGTNGAYQSWDFFPVTYGQGIAYGGDGNIYITGFSNLIVSPFYKAILVRSLTDSGEVRWSYIYFNSSGSESKGLDITYGLDNNIYVCGMYNGSAAILSFTSNGDLRWIYECGSGQKFISITYGTDDYVYTTGNRGTVKLSPDGNLKWINSEVKGSQIVYKEENLYVAAESEWGLQPKVWKLDTLGQQIWSYQSEIKVHSICTGLDENVYLVGSVGSTPDTLKVFCLNGASGEVIWKYKYSGTLLIDSYGTDIDYGLNGFLYITGWGFNPSYILDGIVICLDPHVDAKEPPAINKPFSFDNLKLSIIPNPFVSKTFIKFPIFEFSPKILNIYDINGRLVKTIPLFHNNSEYFAEWNGTDNSNRQVPPGVYYILLKNSILPPKCVLKIK